MRQLNLSLDVRAPRLVTLVEIRGESDTRRVRRRIGDGGRVERRELRVMAELYASNHMHDFGHADD